MIGRIQKIGQTTSLALGSPFQGDFSNLKDSMMGRLGFVAALFIVVSGAIHESSASAALAWEDLTNLVNSLTVTTAHGNYCSSLTGDALCNYLAAAEILEGVESGVGNGADLIHMTDFSSSTSSAALSQIFMVPFADKLYKHNNYSDSEEELLKGAQSVATMKKKGAIDGTLIASLGGNWELYTATTLTATYYAHVVYPRHPVAEVPCFLYEETAAAADNEKKLKLGSSAFAAYDFVKVYDDAFSSFTSSTEVQVTMDGEIIQNLVGGSLLQRLQGPFRNGKAEAYGNDGDMLLDPCSHKSSRSFWRGKEITIINAHAQHGAAKYLYHGYGVATADTIDSQLEAAGVAVEKRREIVNDFDQMHAPRAASRVLRGGLPAGMNRREDLRTQGDRAGQGFQIIID